MNKKNFISVILFVVTVGSSFNYSWVYPEHRDITLTAIQRLNTKYRTLLNSLWQEARRGHESRLSESVIDTLQSIKPEFIDYAAWPAISGDHSCSAANMLDNVLNSDWILKVADVAAQLKIDLANSLDRNTHLNALRNSDINLQNSDPQYATRAGSNNVHFLLALVAPNIDPLTYLQTCFQEGAELNAIGAYVWYHYSAILKISRLSTEAHTPDERSSLIIAALADEAFALHFLEDVFAAGHVAGTRGDASQRKGTHDYYNEMGLKVTTWNGETFVLTGDAWMRKEDAEKAAVPIRLSIEQFLDAASADQSSLILSKDGIINSPDDFNVCKINFMQPREYDSKIKKMIAHILINTPIPGLEEGLGELPRFRAELGMFVGFNPALRGSMLSGGFGAKQETIGFSGGIEAAVCFGLGLEGVLNESGDGLIFFEAGWRQDGSSTIGVIDDPEVANYGSLLSAIPGRSAFSARLRLPFYLIPGDLLLAGPILMLIDPEALTSMGVKAVNGGLIPWQTGFSTSVGRFQFVLGREVGIYLFGRTKERDALFAYETDPNGNEDIIIVSYRSTQFEFPFLEYRPFRSFSTDQSSSLLLQFYAGIDIPHNVVNLSFSDAQTPELRTIWYLGMRVGFDWRHYL